MALKKARSPFSVESYFTEIDDGTMLSDFLRAQAAETPELQDREPVVIPRQTDEPGIEPQTPVVIPERALEDERSGGAAEAGRHESAQPGHSAGRHGGAQHEAQAGTTQKSQTSGSEGSAAKKVRTDGPAEDIPMQLEPSSTSAKTSRDPHSGDASDERFCSLPFGQQGGEIASVLARLMLSFRP